MRILISFKQNHALRERDAKREKLLNGDRGREGERAVDGESWWNRGVERGREGGKIVVGEINNYWVVARVVLPERE